MYWEHGGSRALWLAVIIEIFPGDAASYHCGRNCYESTYSRGRLLLEGFTVAMLILAVTMSIFALLRSFKSLLHLSRQFINVTDYKQLNIENISTQKIRWITRIRVKFLLKKAIHKLGIYNYIISKCYYRSLPGKVIRYKQQNRRSIQ